MRSKALALTIALVLILELLVAPSLSVKAERSYDEKVLPLEPFVLKIPVQGHEGEELIVKVEPADEAAGKLCMVRGAKEPPWTCSSRVEGGHVKSCAIVAKPVEGLAFYDLPLKYRVETKGGGLVNEGAGCKVKVEVERIIGDVGRFKLWVGEELAVWVEGGEVVREGCELDVPGGTRAPVDYLLVTDDPVSGVEVVMTPYYAGIPLRQIKLAFAHYHVDGEVEELCVGQRLDAAFTSSKGSAYFVSGSKRLLAYAKQDGATLPTLSPSGRYGAYYS
ncbi:MAG: hypothetical protein DRJ97_04370 [Thermoprotei archaeon]|nr:MAG: hypothetical protein DRJ97_04370 [Thermoprotei archaeon]